MSRARNKAWKVEFADIKNPEEIDVIQAIEFLCFRFRCIMRVYAMRTFKLKNSIFPFLLGIGIEKIRNPKTKFSK
ncbi:MAG: hypothetical protein ACFE8A_13305 [Candidatus Hodarchaeota archaeon]